MNHPKVPVAREIMISPVVTLRPDMPVPEAAEVLIRKRLSGAPVVDEEGRLLGLLSEFDVLRAVAASEYEMDSHDSIQTVAELMTQTCHTISPDLDLFGIAHEFVRLRVRRFPVLEDGRVVGQVSRHDALKTAMELRKKLLSARQRYPDYPQGRDPIRDYPTGR